MTDFGTLLFPGRRIDGAFPVTDAVGEPVARITAAWSSGRFTVTAVNGAALCDGATSRWWLTGRWQVTDAEGAPLLTVLAKPLRNTAVVSLARGDEFAVRGSPWRQDFAVTDRDGRTVLSGAPATPALSTLRPDYAVKQSTPPAFTVTEVIAIVQVWRMVKKSDVAVLAATSTSVAAAGA